jgi:hypothetical protein
MQDCYKTPLAGLREKHPRITRQMNTPSQQIPAKTKITAQKPRAVGNM